MTAHTIPIVAPFIPTLTLVLLLGPAALLWGAAWAWLSGRLRTRRGVRAPLTRKVFHFAIFTGAFLVQLAWGLPGVVVYGSAVTLLVLIAVVRGDGLPFYEALARPSDAPHRTLFILVPLVTTALGGVLSNVLFHPYAMVGYLVGGWGDAVGEPVGTLWGRRRYRVPSLAGVPATRSIEGSAAVLVVGALGASLALLLGGVPVARALGGGLACGAAGAVVEAFSSHGLDNLTTQLAGAGVAWLLLT